MGVGLWNQCLRAARKLLSDNSILLPKGKTLAIQRAFLLCHKWHEQKVAKAKAQARFAVKWEGQQTAASTSFAC